MPLDKKPDSDEDFSALLTDQPTKRDQQIAELQEALTNERDARREERFIFVILFILLFDVVFFTVMPSFGGPIAILVLQLLILIPLARRMGMEEIAQSVDRVLNPRRRQAYTRQLDFKLRHCRGALP